MCAHMKLRSDSHGVKKTYWKARFSPLALATHSSSRFIFFGLLHSPPSPEYDMAVGLASQLCAHMIQARSTRHMANTIKEHFRHSADENEPRDHMLTESLIPILGTSGFVLVFFFLVELMIFSTVFSSPSTPLSEGLFLHVVFFKAKLEEKEKKKKEEKKKDLALQLPFKAGALITWNRNRHILAFCTIFHSEQFWGHVFHKYPPL